MYIGIGALLLIIILVTISPCRRAPPQPHEGPPTRAFFVSAPGQGARWDWARGRAAAASEGRDVDRLRALVARLLFVRHARALGQRAIAVAVDAGVMDEQVAVPLVGGDEPEALVVAEPLHRPGGHRQRVLRCPLVLRSEEEAPPARRPHDLPAVPPPALTARKLPTRAAGPGTAR